MAVFQTFSREPSSNDTARGTHGSQLEKTNELEQSGQSQDPQHLRGPQHRLISAPGDEHRLTVTRRTLYGLKQTTNRWFNEQKVT